MPAQDGVGRHDGGAVTEELSSNQLAQDRQSASLVIIETRQSRTELFSEDTVLLAEIVKDPLLLAVEPACEAGKEEELG